MKHPKRNYSLQDYLWKKEFVIKRKPKTNAISKFSRKKLKISAKHERQGKSLTLLRPVAYNVNLETIFNKPHWQQ